MTVNLPFIAFSSEYQRFTAFFSIAVLLFYVSIILPKSRLIWIVSLKNHIFEFHSFKL